MKFTKMQGIGNDYVYIDAIENQIDDPSELSKAISDRHFGVGSDGLILIKSSEIADFKMEIYNADGSQAEMCGNGIRCVGKYVYDNELTDKTTITIETLAGIKTLELCVEKQLGSEDRGQVIAITVNMGSPILKPSLIPVSLSDDHDAILNHPVKIAGRDYNISCVSMGNPHCITFVRDVDNVPIELQGPEFEFCKLFPQRTNTEFVEVVDAENIRMRVWERGAGETLACGTGACASAVACILNGMTDNNITVHLKGGKLDIEWERETNEIYMTGPACTVFEGEYIL